MARARHLVVQHLEDVSWRVLEEYPTVAKEFIRRRSGIYALFRRGSLYYVGLARSLMGRLKSHLRDRHLGKWDRFSVYLTVGDDHMKELESLVLRIVKPTGNTQGGGFRKSENLRSNLNNRMRQIDADRRALVMGGEVARRRRRLKARRAKGTVVLAGLVERRTELRAKARGKLLKAVLRRDGRIRFRNKTFDSPSAAAVAAAGGSRNGWWFWKYRNPAGRWLRLLALKR